MFSGAFKQEKIFLKKLLTFAFVSAKISSKLSDRISLPQRFRQDNLENYAMRYAVKTQAVYTRGVMV